MLQKKSAYFAAAFTKDGECEYIEVEVDARSPNGNHPPVLRLPFYRAVETTADDFAMLLTAVEEPMCAPHADRMPFLVGVFRAARALSFEAHREWAEGILERMWSAELDALTSEPMPHAGVALALARTCGLRGVQKRAGYEILRMPTFWKAIAASPLAHVEAQEDSHADADGNAEMGLNGLPGADLLRLLHAREQLALAWAEIARGAPRAFVYRSGMRAHIMPERGGKQTRNNPEGLRLGCTSANADRVHAYWEGLVHKSGLYVRRMNDPLMGLQDLMEIPWSNEGFCKECVAAGKNEWDRFRRALWDDLDNCRWSEVCGLVRLYDALHTFLIFCFSLVASTST